MKKLIPLFIASSIILAACDNEPVVETEYLRPVKFRVIEANSIDNSRTFSGAIQSAQQSRLSFKVSGTIATLPIKVGESVRQGQLLASLDASTYELQAEQSRASLAQASANERNAQAAFERTKNLYENDNASRQQLDEARANAESAVAQTRASAKALELANLNVSYTQLRSPFDCIAASIEVEVNENIAVGTPIITADCGDQLETEIAIPESLITQISEGQAVRITVGENQQSFNGEINEIGTAAGSSASTFPVTIRIFDPNKLLRSGLIADVALDIDTGNENILYVSVSSVNGDSEGSYVYIAEPTTANQAKVVQRRVEIGELTGQGLEVLAGLELGDRLITAGVKTIRPDMTVLLNQE